MSKPQTLKLAFQSAESCLELTIVAMRIQQPDDQDFLRRAMRTYAALVMQENTLAMPHAETQLALSA